MFVLHDVSAQAFNDEERALHAALKPLVGNEDGHLLRTRMHSRASDEALSVILKHLQLRSKRCLLHMQNPGTKTRKAKHRTKHNQTKHAKHKHTQPTQQETAHAVGKVKKVKRWDIRSALSSRTPARSHIDQLPLLSHHRSIYALATDEQRSCQPCPHQCPEHREEMFFEAVSALLGLPSASMFLLGIHECLLCSEVLNVETQHSSVDINSSQRFGGLICFHVALISIPLVVHILRIMTLVFTFLKRIWAVLLDKRGGSTKAHVSGQ